ncbi:MAG: secretin N-terminal domain-containing protein, partial [Candidatus Omnitrophica bacterium]|nr:secretin N-terminal domain-containing protein [Candidatus Omnitrophota bacterium]
MTDKKRILQSAVTAAVICFTCSGVLSAEEQAVPVAAGKPPVAAAQVFSPASASLISGSGMQGKISLDLRAIDVVDALKFLSIKAGLNIITTKSVTGRITLMVENSPIQDVFDIMLRSNNLAYDKRGDIYNVMTQEEYKVLYGKNFSDVRQVKVFYLKYTVPEQAFSVLDMLKSEIGRVLVDPESGNVLVMDSPDKIKTMEKALEDFEEQNTVKVIKLNYAKAKDVEEALKNQLDGKKVGIIKADERGNQIIVQTLPDRMEQIERLVKDLDQKTKEVIVDVNIVNVKLSKDLTEGIRWEGLFDLGKQFGMNYLGSIPFSSVQAASDPFRTRSQTLAAMNGNVGSFPFTGTTSNFSGGKQSIGTQEMHIGIVGYNDFDVILNYLETYGKTKVLSNPKLAVINNQEAKIHVGEKDAYVTTTTTTGQTTNTVSEQVTFVDVGVIISVVPTINNDGFVTLKIKAEINSVLDILVTPTKNQIPILDTSLAETTVMVKDGSTVIIGGLRKDQKVENIQQTPFLGSIPFLGKLFSYKTKSDERTELLDRK